MKIHNLPDVKNWMIRIDDDLSWVEYDFRGGFYRQVCFGTQQIAEKALKAYSFSLKENFSPGELKNLHTHQLIRLVEVIRKYGGSINEQLIPKLKILNRYYMPTRYADVPDPIGKYTEEIARHAIEIAKEIHEFVKEKLKT